ncbi:hypothetical protein Pcinc_017018 [Petrolisthes cinctipes]|uniref:Uncharacterized protein n=1 Tax=Petrolisthes cinctipes TaxID=88211 RepID=A0AAE1FR86_PETCI|nr:hypothetical protein Pcinc_017018 [Petrolisthes cinctipes]
MPRVPSTFWPEEMVSQLSEQVGTLMASLPTIMTNFLTANLGSSPTPVPQPRSSSPHASLPALLHHLPYGAHPSSSSPPTAARVTTATRVDTVETLLKVPKLNREGTPGIVKVGNLSSLHLMDSTFFPLAGEAKHLDILLLLDWAQDSRGTQLKRAPPPVWMGTNRTPTDLMDCLWRVNMDKAIPYQLKISYT